MNEDSMDATRYAYWWLDFGARAAGERLFGRSSWEREWAPGGGAWPGSAATVLRDGPWRSVYTGPTFGAYRVFDGWWRESTPDERRRAVPLGHV